MFVKAWGRDKAEVDLSFGRLRNGLSSRLSVQMDTTHRSWEGPQSPFSPLMRRVSTSPLIQDTSMGLSGF